MARTDDAQLSGRVHELAAPVAEPLGVTILEVEVKGHPGRRLVRLTADVSDLDASAGLDVETIATVSHRVGEVLDEQDVVPGAYTLEVTSPGADRPLRTPRDFVRNAGRDIRLLRSAGPQGRTEVTGTLLGATDEQLTLEVDGQRVDVPLEDVDHGKVVLPW